MADFEAWHEYLCREKNVQMQIGFFNVGDFMHHAAAEAGVRFTEKVLDSDPAVLSLARRSAFHEIANRASDYEHAFHRTSFLLSLARQIDRRDIFSGYSRVSLRRVCQCGR